MRKAQLSAIRHFSTPSGNGIALDGTGNVYVSGEAFGPLLTTSANAPQRQFGDAEETLLPPASTRADRHSATQLISAVRLKTAASGHARDGADVSQRNDVSTGRSPSLLQWSSGAAPLRA